MIYRFAIKQAVAIPLAAYVLLIIVGVFVPGYSSLSQPVSALGLLDSSQIIFRVLAIVNGCAVILLSVGLFHHHLRVTAIPIFLFGVSGVFSGIFMMGSPLHGLYGIGMFMPLAPAFFVAEFRGRAHIPTVVMLSIAVAFLGIFYPWLMRNGFIPDGFGGVAQRVFAVIMFGWFSIVSYTLLRSEGTIEQKPREMAHATAQQG